MLGSAFSLCNMAISGTISLLDNLLDSRREQYTCTVRSSPATENTCTADSPVNSSTRPQPTHKGVRRPRRRIVRLKIKSKPNTDFDFSLTEDSVLSPLDYNTGYITMSSSSRQLKRRRSSNRSLGRPMRLQTIPEEREEVQPLQKSCHWENSLENCSTRIVLTRG